MGTQIPQQWRSAVQRFVAPPLLRESMPSRKAQESLSKAVDKAVSSSRAPEEIVAMYTPYNLGPTAPPLPMHNVRGSMHNYPKRRIGMGHVSRASLRRVQSVDVRRRRRRRDQRQVILPSVVGEHKSRTVFCLRRVWFDDSERLDSSDFWRAL